MLGTVLGAVLGEAAEDVEGEEDLFFFECFLLWVLLRASVNARSGW